MFCKKSRSTDVAQRLIQTTLAFRQSNGQILPIIPYSNCENLIATNELLNSLLPAKQGYCLAHKPHEFLIFVPPCLISKWIRRITRERAYLAIQL